MQKVPPRVLHIVENLNRGATENWLVRMLRYARRQEVDVDWTFYCALGKPGSMDEEARALGASVIYSPVPIGRKADFIRALRNELRRGHYDVLHCHHDLVSAMYLMAAVGMPVRRRIVHVHNAGESVLTPNRVKQFLLRPVLRRICLMVSDRIIGNSNHSLDTMLGGRGRREGKDAVHYLGIDSDPFLNAPANRLGFRRELGLAEDSRLLLFAGRMVQEKNPLFAVDVLAELHRMDHSIVGIFVGSGSLAETVSKHAADLGLGTAIRNLGWRDDVAEIMCCCDWFILPATEQPIEGFGLAVVEAQLAGLPMLLSLGIADDPLLPTAIFRRLPLCAGPSEWAKAAMELSRDPTRSRMDAVAALNDSPMAMDQALEGLMTLHA